MPADPLLHLVTPAQWRAALDTGAIPPADAPFVHLSTPDQVALPANRLYTGRIDLCAAVIDPARVPAEIRWEPGVPGDPASMRFPHAYGPVPTSAVLAVVPYRPLDGRFGRPALPPLDPAGRAAHVEASVLRRVASSEVPVTGGVAIRTDAYPASYSHNALLVDGPADAATVAADADRVQSDLDHRCALLVGPARVATADGLRERGWTVNGMALLAAPTGPDEHPSHVGTPGSRVELVDLATLRPLWLAGRRRDHPGLADDLLAQLVDRHVLAEAVTDVRHLAVRDGTGGPVVAGARLHLDGATAWLDDVETDPAHRGRGHGDALLAATGALAAAAGCDVVGLSADLADWPVSWYRRRGFTDAAPAWFAVRT